MKILRLLLASVLAGSATTFSLSGPAFLGDGRASAIPWRTWKDAASGGVRASERPVYVYLGSELSELSRETEQQIFARKETAAWLSANFTCVRIDGGTEPELAAFVQDLVERVRQQKGPPYHVWLTPGFEPYEATGYLPPSEEWSQPGFLKTARTALAAWRDHPDAVIATTRELRELAQPEAPSLGLPPVTTLLDRGTAAWIAAEDRVHGGFGEAPKEPHADVIRFLLHRGPIARDVALRAVTALVGGSLQDPADGGFFCRTIDEAWREPYRQKRLIDQARIAVALLDAAETARRPDWREAALRALRFGLTRLEHPSGGFYAALDSTDGASPPGRIGVAPLAVQGVFLGALVRAGEPFRGEAEALARRLRAWSQSAILGVSGSRPSGVDWSAADLLGMAFGLSHSITDGDQSRARELTRTALARHHDPRSGLFWAVSADVGALLPWRPLALPSPIRPAPLALWIGVDPGPGDQIRRALRHSIEFDPLPPADVLIALARDAEQLP